jgi:hypothetical protein
LDDLSKSSSIGANHADGDPFMTDRKIGPAPGFAEPSAREARLLLSFRVAAAIAAIYAVELLALAFL